MAHISELSSDFVLQTNARINRKRLYLYCATTLYKLKKGKQETYVKDDSELRELLVAEILDDARLILNKKGSLLLAGTWKIHFST